MNDSVSLAALPDSTASSLIDALRQPPGAERDAAWQRATLVYGPLVYGWMRRYSLQPSDAADVLQEVFLTVSVKIGEFHRDRPGDSFRGWLWTITRNKLPQLVPRWTSFSRRPFPILLEERCFYARVLMASLALHGHFGVALDL